eukprot:CAMPEP_0201124500 /NCGR_PEP_ID=MMETSP0850-20130426/14234_1 /ASSEMBLY_ACC=CAM_ASM_000622 /TAXON_ID=183588 /ORGANISM="Pseudo-nitzschia fraudulenta, Strain WWA7" /LENGTH=80 /DNA_ID=CAMNT_0047391925 /DNA_START=558 /DNA_END=797 /DNA_ORIENTATION=-
MESYLQNQMDVANIAIAKETANWLARLRFNNEIQTEHFGGSCTVSLDGVAVRFFPDGSHSALPLSQILRFTIHHSQLVGL